MRMAIRRKEKKNHGWLLYLWKVNVSKNLKVILTYEIDHEHHEYQGNCCDNKTFYRGIYFYCQTRKKNKFVIGEL